MQTLPVKFNGASGDKVPRPQTMINFEFQHVSKNFHFPILLQSQTEKRHTSRVRETIGSFFERFKTEMRCVNLGLGVIWAGVTFCQDRDRTELFGSKSIFANDKAGTK